MDQFTLTTRAQKGAPLTAAEIDANWTDLVTTIRALMALVPALGFNPTPDGQSLNITLNGNLAGSFALPPGAFNPKGVYTAGTAYKKRDMVTARRSTYYVAADYVAADVDGDLASGNLVLLAGAGGPGYTLQGLYDQTRTYLVSDAVRLPDTPTIWVLTKAAPAGTAPPTAAPFASDFWAASAVGVPFPSVFVKDAAQNKTLDVVLADFESRIAANTAQNAANQANIAAINTQLGQDGVAHFPLVLQ